MNHDAEKHLERAEVDLAKGEGFYRSAAAEIRAAKASDPTVNNRLIAKRLGRSESWISELLTWASSGSDAPTPYSGAQYADRKAVEHAKRVLTNAPVEQVERIVSELPKARRDSIERAIIETHPAHQTKTPLGIGESISNLEANTSFVMLMGGPLARLDDAVGHVRETWEKHEGQATDEQKEIVQEQIRDAIASLLSINSDPQELLR